MGNNNNDDEPWARTRPDNVPQPRPPSTPPLPAPVLAPAPWLSPLQSPRRGARCSFLERRERCALPIGRARRGGWPGPAIGSRAGQRATRADGVMEAAAVAVTRSRERERQGPAAAEAGTPEEEEQEPRPRRRRPGRRWDCGARGSPARARRGAGVRHRWVSGWQRPSAPVLPAVPAPLPGNRLQPPCLTPRNANSSGRGARRESRRPGQTPASHAASLCGRSWRRC
ncbi:hypothetical protein P7K49_011956 [Saguinus oedipus]|uniref:Uncharacterized protein n=1 Tax=Saguinus oedipus TaxID=9490 RepID=A0ABQ9VTN9_SAGOE|nr:hypothetical protein P7K49_011956 [Saguinus oedipus]